MALSEAELGRPPSPPSPAALPIDAGPGLRPRVFAGLGAGAWWTAWGTPSPALTLVAGIAPLDRVRVAVLLAGAGATETEVRIDGQPRGSLWLQPALAAAQVDACAGGDALLACGGLVGGARLSRAGVTGLVYQASQRVRGLPALGGRLRVSRAVGLELELSLEALVLTALGEATFYVEGASGATARTPRLDVLSYVAVTWSPAGRAR